MAIIIIIFLYRLHTMERFRNPNPVQGVVYSESNPEYLMKSTISGMWRLCQTDRKYSIKIFYMTTLNVTKMVFNSGATL